MSCSERLLETKAGNDISFKWRYKDSDGTYPDISDVTARFVGKIDEDVIFDISYPPTGTGTRIEFGTDTKSQFLNIIIEGEDTVGFYGDMLINYVVDSFNSGRITKPTCLIKICKGDL